MDQEEDEKKDERRARKMSKKEAKSEKRDQTEGNSCRLKLINQLYMILTTTPGRT